MSEYLSQRHFYPAVPHGHRGGGARSSTCGTGSTATPWSTSSSPWPPPRSGTSTCCRRKSSASTGRSSPPTSTGRRTAPGSSSSPGTTPPRTSFELIGITDTCMLRPQVFALSDRGSADRPGLLREAGHRRHPGAAWPRRTPASARWPTCTGTPGAAAPPTAAPSSSPWRARTATSPLLPRQVRQPQDRALAPAPLGRLPARR